MTARSFVPRNRAIPQSSLQQSSRAYSQEDMAIHPVQSQVSDSLVKTLSDIASLPNDLVRRKSFKTYLLQQGTGIDEDNNISHWDRIQAALTSLGEEAQAVAWEAYVVNGFQPLVSPDPLLWAYIDMTVQLRAMRRKGV